MLNPHAHQRGAVLLIALIMLLILTLLATTSIREATLQTRLGGVLAEDKLALNAAESALREAERKIAANSTLDEGVASCTASVAEHAGLCVLNNELAAEFFEYSSHAQSGGALADWWDSSLYALGYSGSDDAASFSENPQWNLAYYGFDPGNEVTNVEEAAYGVGPHYYVATAAGEAGGKRLTRVLQSVTVRRY